MGCGIAVKGLAFWGAPSPVEHLIPNPVVKSRLCSFYRHIKIGFRILFNVPTSVVTACHGIRHDRHHQRVHRRFGDWIFHLNPGVTKADAFVTR
ncbi:hypothetical protein [Oscillatoria sp. HE19RPO]|uniref:hypothetical protein n=1 Tax=Oscillatoria sp. HE19RPO TaxID=2954806 RepID=UPI0020C4215F|nr:hypothetical protein [Oscillatoria sp. HE19RPO]